MMSPTNSVMFRLLLVFFFGSVTLIGRAQNDFFQFDTNFPSRTLFPFVDGTVFNIKDLVDDVSSIVLPNSVSITATCTINLSASYLFFNLKIPINFCLYRGVYNVSLLYYRVI